MSRERERGMKERGLMRMLSWPGLIRANTYLFHHTHKYKESKYPYLL